MNPDIHTDIHIQGDRLWQSLMELARIGATPKGGLCRLALSPLDGQAREQFMHWAQDAGCTLRIDAIGNIFARRPGRDPARAPVATGSHLDTQPTGGKFDGIYGVLAGLEVVRTLNDHGVVTEAPIEVVVWTNEEGSRFVPVMMGSGVYAGAFSLDHALAQRDHAGISVAQALQALGHAGEAPASARHHPLAAYVEAHIEQGPVLEARDCVIGVVEGALGQRWYDLDIQGQEAHAGPTPMAMRRDALLVAARLIQAVNQIALEQAPHGRGTVGWLEAFPNSRNVIPGRVRLSVDLRAATAEALDRMEQQLHAAMAEVGRPGVALTLERVVEFPPQPFDPALVRAIRDAAGQQGWPSLGLVSGAGHDAVHVAGTCPAAMIFVPCKGGVSHNEIEDARPEHLAAGCQVLLQVLLSRAQT